MAWEEFRYRGYGRGGATSSCPTLALNRGGTVTFNPAAYAAIGKPCRVVYLFSAEERIVGLRAARDDEQRISYRVTPVKNSTTLRVTAKSFIRHFGLEDALPIRDEATVLHDGDTPVLTLKLSPVT